VDCLAGARIYMLPVVLKEISKKISKKIKVTVGRVRCEQDSFLTHKKLV
jgi:hypothetical protein